MNTSDIRMLLEKVARKDQTVMRAIRALQREEKAYQKVLAANRIHEAAGIRADSLIGDVLYTEYTKPARKSKPSRSVTVKPKMPEYIQLLDDDDEDIEI